MATNCNGRYYVTVRDSAGNTTVVSKYRVESITVVAGAIVVTMTSGTQITLAENLKIPVEDRVKRLASAVFNDEVR